jgi:hypothetical protein
MKRIQLFVVLAAIAAAVLLAAARTVALGGEASPGGPDAKETSAKPEPDVKNERDPAVELGEESRDGERGEEHDRVAPGAPDESVYMDRLRSLAGRDPERALALADAGENRYAGGKYEEERRATAINVLVRLGRMGEARARTRAFIRRYPHGRFTRQVRGLTGVHPRPAGPNRELEW